MPTLKELRESIPLSTRELAKEASVSQFTIVRLENSRNKPQAATVRALVRAFNKHLQQKITAKDIQW
jgi:predicted transcriptional regulator